MNRPTCETCPFWHRKTKDIGECRRHAPPPIAAIWVPNHSAVSEGFLSPHWRVTFSNQWCGEHPDIPVFFKSLKEEETNDE